MIKHIDPQEALRLINEDTLLIAVREPDEHPRERIPNAGLIPLSRLSTPLDRHDARRMIFHCRTGGAEPPPLRSGSRLLPAATRTFCAEDWMPGKQRGCPF